MRLLLINISLRYKKFVILIKGAIFSMDVEQIYEELLTNKIERIKDHDNVLLILQGFPYVIYNALQNLGIKHLVNKKFMSYIDYKKISGHERELLSALMTHNGIGWIFYEEFIAIAGVVHSISGLYNGRVVLLKNNLFDQYYPIPVPGDYDALLNESEKISAENNEIFKYYSECKLIGGLPFFSYINKHYEVDIGIHVEEIELFDRLSDNPIDDGSYTEIEPSELKLIVNDIQCGNISNRRYVVTDYSAKLNDELPVINFIGEKFNVLITHIIQKKQSQFNENEFLPILKEYWGEDSEFRYNKFYKDPDISTETVEISQGEIISDIAAQCEKGAEGNDFSDIIVTAPTGAGKSLLFQIPAINLYKKHKSVTIVICPLVALMVDQVKELADRGIGYATYINSSISFEERKERLHGIQNGKYSIIYLSPELLLSMDIKSIIGERPLGLIVVDEAHLVTSWGRDFRVDYWFLGDYLEKIRRGSYYYKGKCYNVPVLCLTATAVYGGNEDVIGELENSLHLICNGNQHYIGYVKRENIEFNIRHPRQQRRSGKEEKVSLTYEEIKRCVEKSIKTIMYFPFKSSIKEVENVIKGDKSVFDQIVVYHGGDELTSFEKDAAYTEFKNNSKTVMLATKAFGMGINISDIKEVYHHAPTGTLSDYVQEIGRAARKLDKGYAVTDYIATDMHYAKTLWGLSGIKQYQTKEIIKKLYQLYEQKGNKRNLLVSPDAFNYLFDNNSVESKIKSALMLISSDLEEKYKFKVITVRAKSLLSRQYIMITKEHEKEFLDNYGMYCKPVPDVKERKELGYVKIYKRGNVYEINLAALWENNFSDMTFAKFKHEFFKGNLFGFETGGVVPNTKLVIHYKNDYYAIEDEFYMLSSAVQKTFNQIKREFGQREFKESDFVGVFRKYYSKPVRRELLLMLLDLFCYDHIDIDSQSVEKWKFISRVKSRGEGITSIKAYCIREFKYAGIEKRLNALFKNAKPNDDDNGYATYIPIVNGEKGSAQEYQLLASLLQLFDLAAYEFLGGCNPEIFVRINDPMKLNTIAHSDRYNNRMIQDINKRHERAASIMSRFMNGEYSNDERWGIIEEYFLGHDEAVDYLLDKGSN